MPGTLYLIATPIGNLGDMSPRAIETMKNVDVIACEDTRHTLKLLNHFGITKKLVSYHEHNESIRADELIEMLSKGQNVGLVSDAGTPAINDPGLVLVRKARNAGAEVISIPGPVAFVNAVVVSGLPTDSLFFGGFLPSKQGDRRKRLAEVAAIPATLIFYESPHRIGRSLADCLDILGDRSASVSRELTKIHEETLTGSLSSILERILSANSRGEYVLIIDRERDGQEVRPVSSSLQERVAELEAAGHDNRAALKIAAKEHGLSRSEAYRQLQLSRPGDT
ncbi:MAG: 16S rRNA (cytidine(1402)-2'-O)-methyltransferase [Acidobacteria bacterium]|nr:16S rRNA (cytidine(1402)-2'-O)-methyltransferase [Acidobacteriota bacterium]